MKKKKLRNTRPKALFGEVAAAGITAAATLAAAGIGAAATAKAAKEQSDATIANAKQQADAIEQTNLNNNQLQQQSQQFIAQENEANRQIQRDLQMNLQLQGGQLDMEQRRAASRIQVKKGGKVSRKKLRDISFYGGGNLPFHVTDGGGVLPLGQTPEGYDLYEIIGNDHNHYHSTRKTYTKGGKYKSGVGIKFGTGQVVEGEGNQNTGQGELLLVTPDSGMFISKHSINGFNPAQAVMAGMHPLDAYAVQEASKGSSPVRRNGYKALAGVSTNYILPTDYPINDLGFDMSGINAGTVRRKLKKGGRCKAANGTILGGWITGGANLLSGALAGIGSWYGNKYAADAYPKAAKYLTNAYDNLRTIDMSGIRRDTFGNQHYMPVVRSSNYNVNDQLGDVNRTARSTMKAVNNSTLSSAARLSRMSGINDAVIAAKSKIYADKYNKEEATKQHDLDAINEAARQNVLMDVEANKDFARTYVDLLKYNNDIVNEGITGKAQALADSIMGVAQARGAGIQGLLGNIGVGIQGFGTNVGKAYAQNYKQNLERDQVLFGMPLENQVEWAAQRGTPAEKARLINSLKISRDNATDQDQIKQIDMWIAKLKGKQTLRNTPSNWDKLQDYMSGMRDVFRVQI